MQTVTKTFNIYEFDELATGIQEELIKKEEENLRQAEIEDFLPEEMEVLAIQLLEENFEGKAVYQRVYYSLAYCQGDGAMIEFDLMYHNKPLQIRRCDRFYRHERSFEILGSDKLTDEQHEQLKEKIIDMNKKLTQYGYEFIEEDRTEQAIDQLKNCMFYENGDIY